MNYPTKKRRLTTVLIPLAGYADHNDQEASEDEWEISRKSSAGNGRARNKAGRKSS